MIAVGVFKICVERASRIFRKMCSGVTVNNEERIFNEDALEVVAVFWATITIAMRSR